MMMMMIKMTMMLILGDIHGKDDDENGDYDEDLGYYHDS